MISLILFTILFLAVGVGLFAGLFVCARIEIGDFMFTELRRDILKCVLVAGVTAAAGVGLFASSQNPWVFSTLPPVWFIALKLCWLDLQIAEIGVIGASSILSLGILIALARAALVS